jgi:hypothetical protein
LGSRSEGEFEAGEVAGSAAVEGMVVEPGIEADEVEGDGFVVVFEASLGQAAVAGVSGIGDFCAFSSLRTLTPLRGPILVRTTDRTGARPDDHAQDGRPGA